MPSKRKRKPDVRIHFNIRLPELVRSALRLAAVKRNKSMELTAQEIFEAALADEIRYVVTTRASAHHAPGV